MLPIITAFAEGKSVIRGSVICNTDDAEISFDELEDRYYKVVEPPPKPKYRPWTFEEVPVGKVVRIDTSRYVISRVFCDGRGVVIICVAAGAIRQTAQDFLENGTMDDGTPCGVLEP